MRISYQSEAGKELDKCVPFHFHTHTEFDVAVQKQRQSEGPYIYLAVERVVARNKKFKIIPRHPISEWFENRGFRI